MAPARDKQQQVMTPRQYYQQALQRNDFQPDPVQAQVVELLEQHFARLFAKSSAKSSANANSPVLLNGLYLWGKVGRGKTFLMDAFYQCIEHNAKQRVHFYRFMQDLHRQLAAYQGRSDPLLAIANQMAKQIRVLCFDEFFVSDIADAMLLSGLLRPLFAQGVFVIATSNVAPGRLYENGLQRQRFIPAIQAIEANMQIVHLDGAIDHRLRTLAQAPAYFLWSKQPTDPANPMLDHFRTTCADQFEPAGQILIEQRPINYAYIAANAIWFDFDQLCQGARSQNDYIALAGRYRDIYIANVPSMGGVLTDRTIAHGTEDGVNGSQLAQLNRDRQQIMRVASKSDDQARRFIALVDEFYDRKVRLYLSSEVPILQLYQGGLLTFEFERAVSRLLEMQSVAYSSSCR